MDLYPPLQIELPACPRCHTPELTCQHTRDTTRYYVCNRCGLRFKGIVVNPRQKKLTSVPTVGITGSAISTREAFNG